jgi:hypothetical protein
MPCCYWDDDGPETANSAKAMQEIEFECVFESRRKEGGVVWAYDTTGGMAAWASGQLRSFVGSLGC